MYDAPPYPTLEYPLCRGGLGFSGNRLGRYIGLGVTGGVQYSDNPNCSMLPNGFGYISTVRKTHYMSGGKGVFDIRATAYLTTLKRASKHWP